jgi:hypothetical protein
MDLCQPAVQWDAPDSRWTCQPTQSFERQPARWDGAVEAVGPFLNVCEGT